MPFHLLYGYSATGTSVLHTIVCATCANVNCVMQVLESGTGSGSLTHSLARAVAPAGAVHTFEFHKQRCEEADAEFKQNGIADIVHSTHRDIEALGFPESCHGIADGIILDLPAPWKVRHRSSITVAPSHHPHVQAASVAHVHRFLLHVAVATKTCWLVLASATSHQ